MYGVTPQMIDTFGDTIFNLSINIQRRWGDPIRKLDFAQIEANREGAGLSDAEIAAKIGLTTEQVRYIRVVMERRRFRRDQYRKLFELGVGTRYRDEKYEAPAKYRYQEDAMTLRAAMQFDPEQVSRYVEAGYWQNDTLSGWLAARVGESADHPAIIAGVTTITYGELQAKSRQLAGALQKLGVKEGDVVSVQLPNVPEFLISFLAITHLGGVMSTIHMPYRAAEFRHLLSHSRAKAVICLSRFKEYDTAAEMLKLRDELPNLEHVITLAHPSPTPSR